MVRASFLVLIALLAHGANAEWTMRKDGRPMNGIVDAGGRLVVFGSGSALWTSDNGTDWTTKLVPGNPQIQDMAWSGKLLEGITSTGDAVTSTDGDVWQLRKRVLAGGTNWNRIVWIKDSFTVFDGLKQRARLAPDFGSKVVASTIPGTLKQIFADSTQITMLLGGTKQDSILTSTDGRIWNAIVPTRTRLGKWLDKDEKGWLMSYEDDTLLRSDDLVNWTATPMVDSAGKSMEIKRVFRVGGRYYGGGKWNDIYESSDGMVWKVGWKAPGEMNMNGIVLRTPNRPHYLSTDFLLGMPDSTHGWQMEREFMVNYLEGVGWKNGLLHAYGAMLAELESTDGKNWTIRHGLHLSVPLAYTAVADFGDTLQPLGELSFFPTAPDSVDNIQGLPRCGWVGDGRRVVAGDEGMLISSGDGKYWQDHKHGDVALRSGGWHDGLHVAVGDTILTSPDGRVWTGRTRAIRAHLFSVAWGAGRWIAVGSGTVQASTDGLSWTALKASGFPAISTLRYGGGRFVAVGSNGVVLVSSDGNSWDSANVGADVVLDDVAWTGAGWVAVGQYGTIFTEGDPVVPPPVATEPRSPLPSLDARWNGRFLSTPAGTAAVDLVDPAGRILSFRPNVDGRIDLRALPSGFWIARGTGDRAWTLRLVR